MATATISSASPAKLFKIALYSSVVMSAGLAAFFYYSYKPIYQAYGLIEIAPTAPYIAFPDVNQSSPDRYVETQKELMLSTAVLVPVLSRPEVAKSEGFFARPPSTMRKPDPTLLLQKNLSLNQIGMSDLYEVSYKSPSPQVAADVANAVLAEYLAIQSDEEFHRTQRVIDILEEERRKRSLDVERLRAKVISLAKKTTGRDPFTGALLDLGKDYSSVKELYERLEETNISREILERRIQELLKRSAPPIENSPSNQEATSDDDSLTEIKDGQEALETVLSFAKSMQDLRPAWGENAEIVDLMNVLQGHLASLENIKHILQSHLSDQQHINHKPSHQQSITAMESELRELNIRYDVLTKQFHKRLEDVKQTAHKSIELEFTKAELAREEHVLELISTRLLQLQTELRAPTRVHLRQKASPPRGPVDDFRYKQLMLGCITIFAANYAIALACYLFSKKPTDGHAP